MQDAAPLSLISLGFALFAAPRAACGEGGLSLLHSLVILWPCLTTTFVTRRHARNPPSKCLPPPFLSPLLTEAAAAAVVALLCPLITKCVFLRVIFSIVVLYSVEKVRGTKGKERNLRPNNRANILALRRNPHSCRTVLKTRHLRRNSIWCSSERATSEKAGERTELVIAPYPHDASTTQAPNIRVLPSFLSRGATSVNTRLSYSFGVIWLKILASHYI